MTDHRQETWGEKSLKRLEIRHSLPFILPKNFKTLKLLLKFCKLHAFCSCVCVYVYIPVNDPTIKMRVYTDPL